MKTITEAEAQQLANLLGLWIAFDDCQFGYAYYMRPYIGSKGYWHSPDGLAISLPIRIASDRPWTEQIWGPE